MQKSVESVFPLRSSHSKFLAQTVVSPYSVEFILHYIFMWTEALRLGQRFKVCTRDNTCWALAKQTWFQKRCYFRRDTYSVLMQNSENRLIFSLLYFKIINHTSGPRLCRVGIQPCKKICAAVGQARVQRLVPQTQADIINSIWYYLLRS